MQVVADLPRDKAKNVAMAIFPHLTKTNNLEKNSQINTLRNGEKKFILPIIMALPFCHWNYTNKTSSLTCVLMYLGLSTSPCELIQGLHKKGHCDSTFLVGHLGKYLIDETPLR